MPRSFYEAEEDQDKTPCGKLREDLKYCLQQTDCFKLVTPRLHNTLVMLKAHWPLFWKLDIQEGKTMKECLMTQHPSVPQECYQLRTSFFTCKRSLVGLVSLAT